MEPKKWWLPQLCKNIFLYLNAMPDLAEPPSSWWFHHLHNGPSTTTPGYLWNLKLCLIPVDSEENSSKISLQRPLLCTPQCLQGCKSSISGQGNSEKCISSGHPWVRVGGDSGRKQRLPGKFRWRGWLSGERVLLRLKLQSIAWKNSQVLKVCVRLKVAVISNQSLSSKLGIYNLRGSSAKNLKNKKQISLLVQGVPEFWSTCPQSSKRHFSLTVTMDMWTPSFLQIALSLLRYGDSPKAGSQKSNYLKVSYPHPKCKQPHHIGEWLVWAYQSYSVLDRISHRMNKRWKLLECAVINIRGVLKFGRIPQFWNRRQHSLLKMGQCLK